MPDELLTIFKICFLVLLYLFFFRVLRAVWTEVNAAPVGAEPAVPTKAPKAPKPPKKAKASKEPAPPPEPTVPTTLVAVDPEHLAGIAYPLVDGMVVGRGDQATIVLDDNFLSSRHASFHHRDDGWVVEDLGSTNGTYLDNVKVDRIARLHPGDRVQLGNVILEVR